MMRTFLVNLFITLLFFSIGLGFLIYSKKTSAAGVKYYIELRKHYNDNEANKIEYERGNKPYDSLLLCKKLTLSKEFKLALEQKYKNQNILFINTRCKPMLPTEIST